MVRSKSHDLPYYVRPSLKPMQNNRKVFYVYSILIIIDGGAASYGMWNYEVFLVSSHWHELASPAW